MPAKEDSASDSRPAVPAPERSDSPPTVTNELRLHAGWKLNEYELLEPIGRGGMGVVYRARHARLQRTVAVKVLPRMSLPDESAVVRMQRESAAAGRVQHPNIVYATDAGECDGAHYLVMEYVQGFDLSKLVAASGRLPIAEACEIARQAALGLAHIADCGLVHRDLKPSNVMLADDGSVKILDLGLALLHHNPLDDYEATQPGYLLGTADYIAPEQIDAPHEVDVRSDLYSLGCTLFKLLTGVAPFSGPEQNSVSRKVEAHRRRTPPRVASLRPDVPPEVDQLMNRLLAKRPSDRFQRPDQLAAALAPLSKGADLSALARRMRESGNLNAQPLGAPVDSRATTQSLARTATTRHLVATLRAMPVWAKVTALLLLVGTLAGSLAGLGAIVGRDRAPIVYDLRKPLKAYTYSGFEASKAPVFDTRKNMLEADPSAHQLIQIGEYKGRPGTFSFTISQSPWHGFAGMYFGLREEARLGRGLTTMQLFLFEHFPAVGTGDGSMPEKFSFTRRRAYLPVSEHHQIHADRLTGKSDTFNAPESRSIRFDITFGTAGCERVAANGQVLALLSDSKVNEKYLDEDYRGPFGLYCLPGQVEKGSSWFGNLVFTPAE